MTGRWEDRGTGRKQQKQQQQQLIHFREKDAVKDALYDKLTKYFQVKGDNYDEMVRKAREAEDARIAEEEATKAAKKKKATDETLAHLNLTIKEHEDQKRKGVRWMS